MVGQLIPDCYVELEKIILSERKAVPVEFPVINRKRLLQLVREHQLQLDENELPHAVHFLNESGLCACSGFWLSVLGRDNWKRCLNLVYDLCSKCKTMPLKFLNRLLVDFIFCKTTICMNIESCIMSPGRNEDIWVW